MCPIILSNIKKIINEINSGNLEFNPFVPLGVNDHYITTKPIITLENKTYTTKSINHLSFYILPHAIRALLKSINFHISGDLLIGKKLYSSTILNYYSSSYANLESFLALNGILYFYPIYTIKEEKVIVDYSLKALRFSTKKSKWIIENRKLSHKERWYEMKKIYRYEKDAPLYILNLFNYFFKSDFYNKINNNDEITYEKYIDKFYKIISNIRHDSAYNSQGIDIGIIYEQMNGEDISESKISMHEQSFKYLSESMIMVNSKKINLIIEKCKISDETRKAIFLTTINEPFDEVIIERIENQIMKKEVKNIYNWLINKL